MGQRGLVPMLQRRTVLKSTNQSRTSSSPSSPRSLPPHIIKRSRKCWHGLIAHLEDGSEVLEKNHYWHSGNQKRYATNWWEIPKEQIVALELFFKGESILKLDMSVVRPDSWVFSHTGSIDLSKGREHPVVLTRNIGFVKDGIKNTYRVSEETGAMTFDASPV